MGPPVPCAPRIEGRSLAPSTTTEHLEGRRAHAPLPSAISEVSTATDARKGRGPSARPRALPRALHRSCLRARPSRKCDSCEQVGFPFRVQGAVPVAVARRLRWTTPECARIDLRSAARGLVRAGEGQTPVQTVACPTPCGNPMEPGLGKKLAGCGVLIVDGATSHTRSSPGRAHCRRTAGGSGGLMSTIFKRQLSRSPYVDLAVAGMAAVALAVAGCGGRPAGSPPRYGAPAASPTVVRGRLGTAPPARARRSLSRDRSSAGSSSTARGRRCTCSRPTRLRRACATAPARLRGRR